MASPKPIAKSPAATRDAFVIDPSIAVARRSPAESGRATYANNEAISTTVAAAINAAKMVAEIQNEKPEPVALHLVLRVAGIEADTDVQTNMDTFATPPAGFVWGGVVIDFGDLTGNHRVVADFKSGVYQLPACTYARVKAFLWAPGGVNISGYDLVFASTLSRSTVQDPKSFQVTLVADMAAGANAFARMPAPGYLRFFDVWADGWNGGQNGIGTAGAPIIRTSQIAIERNYQTGVFSPPWGPLEVSSGQQGFTVYNQGPAQVRVVAKFILEL